MKRLWTNNGIKIEWLLFALVVALAIFFRFYHLSDLPLGLPTDAAINGNDAWRLLNRGGHTVFFSGNGGREAMLIYLQAAAIAVWGTTPLAVRFPTAFFDLLSVLLITGFSYWLFRTHTKPWRQWAALWAGLAAATSYWLVVISRLGFRGALVPFFAVALFWSFLLGWRSGRLGWFLMAGLSLGLAGYTYAAANVLPVILVLTLLPELLRPVSETDRDQPRLRHRLGGLGVMVVLALIVYSPMLIYNLNHPNQLANRPSSVAIWSFTDSTSDLLQALAENLALTAGFFCCLGNEQLALFGLPGRPGQDFILGLLLLMGIIVSFKKIGPRGQIETRLLVIWFFVAWLPTLLSIEAPHPLRLIAAAPAAILLAVSGMLFLSSRGSWGVWLPIVLTGWLLLAAVVTFRDYFIRWPVLGDVPGLFSYHRVEQARTMQSQIRIDQVIYLPQTMYAEPRLSYYLKDTFPPTAIGEFQETDTEVTVIGSPETGAWVRLSDSGAQIMPPISQASRGQLGEFFGAARVDTSALVWAKPDITLDAQFGPAKLTGAAFTSLIDPAEPLEVTLFWEAAAAMDDDYQVITQLIDDAGQTWSLNEGVQAANGAYPTSYWRPGLDQVPDFHVLELKESLPVGRYWLAVALYDPTRDRRLPLTEVESDSPDTVFLGPLKVPLAASEAASPAIQTNVRFGDVAQLQGLSLEPQPVAPGDPLSITLVWQPTTNIDLDYTVFVHVLDAAGNRVAGHDSEPYQGQYPTSIWTPGETIPDTHMVDMSGVPPGQYQLGVGLYLLETGERIPIDGAPDGRAILDRSTVTIAVREP